MAVPIKPNEKVRLLKTSVLRACFNGLIKTLYSLDYWNPREIF